MAAFTPTGVKAGVGSTVTTLQQAAAEALSPGEAVTGSGYIVDPNDSDKFDIIGICVSDIVIGGPPILISDGEITVTNTLTPQRQIIAAPAGQWQYDDDLLSGDGYVIIGYVKDANTIVVRPFNTEDVKA